MNYIKLILISLFFVPFLVFAQAGLPAEGLPKAGLTPESPFYFLDRFGEALQEFFTFNPEGKARLQITFVSERVAEIKVILETKGVEAKGLDVAQSRLQASLAKVATIVTDQKSKGKDVSDLAKELNDDFETPKSALSQTFRDHERALEAREDELKGQLRAAHLAGDTAREEAIAAELGQVKGQQELMKVRAEDIENDLETEEERLEEQMDAQHKAQEAIREAEEEKQEIVDEAVEENVELPANAFAEFDNLLSQAQAAFNTGGFPEARNLAKQAENSLEQVENVIEELKEQQELQEEAEEAIQEVEEEKQDVLNDAAEDDITVPAETFGTVDRLLDQAKSALATGNFQEAKRLAEQAEKNLDSVEEAIEDLEDAKEEEEEQEEKLKEEAEKDAEERLREVGNEKEDK
jgi:hypothetical protein